MSCIETRTITIKAKRDPTDFSGFDFKMFEDGNRVDDDTIVSDKDKLKNAKKCDFHTFIFKLENAEGSDLKFVDNPFDVMWVKTGNATHAGECPKRRSNDRDFCIASIADHELVVHNANSRKCKHKFVLNFVGTKADGSQGMVSYDPVWTNSNGGARER